MKTLATLIRHAVTYLVGILLAWFTVHLTAPQELKSATEAANALVEPLVIVVGFVGVILARLAMPLLNNIFRRGAGEVNDSDAGASGGKFPLALLLCAAAGLMGVLPSCATRGDGEYPVTASLSWRDPNTGAKAGLVYTPKAKLKGGK